MNHTQVRRALFEARELGYLGPGDPDAHLLHAEGFVAVAVEVLGRIPRMFVDLGTGGGVPGLVLAVAWPESSGVLIESSRKRCASLEGWLRDLGRAETVAVVEGRAEELAHDPALRESADVVTARGFAAPPITAEVGSGFLAVGGVLVVSEPPGGDPSRWPAKELETLALGEATTFEAVGATYVGISKASSVLEAVPRRRSRPWKRPLW